MEQHSRSVANIAVAIRNCFEDRQSFRIFHGSSNSTRPGRLHAGSKVIDITALSNVVSVNCGAKVALVEPNVPMDRLVEATLSHGLIPPVVMEFPGITTGGGFSGTSGESSSFRHGFFSDTINSVEMVLGNGEIVAASRTERADLFYGAAGAAGTLGVITLLEVRLIEAKKFVRTTYQRVKTVDEALSQIQSATNSDDNDYVDGILFDDTHSAVITGQLVDEKPADYNVQTFSDAADPWFYMHVHEVTRTAEPTLPFVDYIPLAEYLFRYDRAAFWVGRQGYTYFKYIPFNSFFRWLLDDFSHARTLYHALHSGGISSRFMVQDVALPYDAAKEFIQFVTKDMDIRPLWLCPLRHARTPTFHPVTCAGDDLKKKGLEGVSGPMLNIGVWGWGPRRWNDFVSMNRVLESKLHTLGGRKWLYAHCYYTEDEFWGIYDRTWYDRLRHKYHATALPTVFDKVTINVEAQEREQREWGASIAALWPIGGMYGIWKAAISGDWRLHREALWKRT
ncbi:hypothetical protein JDV02_007220 [Purpureocillium takamizusanense]|uniref:Delta(24)-sterol reductase n=1 Tax=Purpureocillium takamizusanense TaxID=2060973 RepID=A0A9Q8QKD9_9HYPO|nr:uncharacterized protein JDV02_007220 [Purpureocillium takamizusanense]UNI21210.1 hypothetical protein JDV02_007220 [Purpureocillium takamizusanense]